MGRQVEGSVNGTPSVVQAAGLLADWLRTFGRLTMPQAGRLCCGLMLGDWNQLPKARRRYFMGKAQRTLINLSRVLPLYSLRWHPRESERRVVRVWYYTGREPRAQLAHDLRRPGCDSD